MTTERNFSGWKKDGKKWIAEFPDIGHKTKIVLSIWQGDGWFAQAAIESIGSIYVRKARTPPMNSRSSALRALVGVLAGMGDSSAAEELARHTRVRWN